MRYVDVAVAVPVDHAYTYRVPDELDEEIAVGKRVLVPFGRKYMTGYVVAISNSTDFERVKDIVDLLDSRPVVTHNILRLTQWISEYYFCPWGMALKAALPAGIDRVHAVRISLNTSQNGHFNEDLFHHAQPVSSMGKVQKKILTILREHSPIALKDLQKKVGKKSLNSSLYSLERQGIIFLEQVLKAETAKPKTLQHIALALPPEDLHTAELERRAPKQAAVIKIMEALYPNDIPVAQLREILQFDPRATLKPLTQKGYIQVYAKEIRRQPAGHFAYQKTAHLPLTQQQQVVLNHLKAAIDSGRFAPILLHGVTGSGKTEVYIQAIDYLLSLKRRAIVMVPEISLTPLLVSRFLSRFENNVAVLHSGLSTGERYDEWLRIRQGEADVVIGARSAIFAPVNQLGIIVVDEEHEMSYKQDTEPRYHGRDTAVKRAQLENIPVLLGSATPSLESFYNAKNEKYHLVTLPARIDNRPLPTVEIIDKRKEQRQHIFSNALEGAMREVVVRNEQVLLFLNLRGFANFYLCRECGFVYECPRCNVTLTYHASYNRLQCHYCDFSRVPPTRCEHCGSLNVQYRGLGTERIEEEVKLLFPEAVTVRMDRDTVSGKDAHYKILSRVDQGEVDILIGTQMVTKGHDFPHVTLVGVLAAEIGLHLPDFRSSERTFQILTQVAGRTGRGDLGGKVLIQTYTPKHYAILTAQTHDYAGFYNREIVYRQRLNYPPFARVINIILQGRDEIFTREIAQRLVQHLQRKKPQEIFVLGPAPAALTKLREKYRYQVLLKSRHSLAMRTFVKEQLIAFRKTTQMKDVQCLVDVDPVHLL